jgi:ketosteroid isomerase-like protein
MALNCEDELAILQLLNRYAPAGSRQDTDELVDLFVEDCVWERKQGATAGKYTDVLRVEGRKAWREWVLKSWENQGQLRHQYVAANAVISGDRHLAKAVSTAFVFGIGDGPVSIVLVGNFEDEFRKTDAGWKFSYRGMSLST